MTIIPANEVLAEVMSKETLSELDRQSAVLIKEYETLRKLHQARALMQEKVALELGKSPGAVEKMEERADVLISTLRAYVEELGGELDLIVRFPDHRPVLLDGISENSLPLAWKDREGVPAHVATDDTSVAEPKKRAG